MSNIPDQEFENILEPILDSIDQDPDFGVCIFRHSELVAALQPLFDKYAPKDQETITKEAVTYLDDVAYWGPATLQGIDEQCYTTPGDY